MPAMRSDEGATSIEKSVAAELVTVHLRQEVPLLIQASLDMHLLYVILDYQESIKELINEYIQTEMAVKLLDQLLLDWVQSNVVRLIKISFPIRE